MFLYYVHSLYLSLLSFQRSMIFNIYMSYYFIVETNSQMKYEMNKMKFYVTNMKNNPYSLYQLLFIEFNCYKLHKLLNQLCNLKFQVLLLNTSFLDSKTAVIYFNIR